MSNDENEVPRVNSTLQQLIDDFAGMVGDLSDDDAARLALRRATPEVRALVPVVPDLYVRVLEAIEREPRSFYMGDWHSSCGIQHCLAGWAVELAGSTGRMLEAIADLGHHVPGSEIAGALIYHRSTGRVSDFYADQDAALLDIERCAGRPCEVRARIAATEVSSLDDGDESSPDDGGAE